jgi:hypothetical protein
MIASDAPSAGIAFGTPVALPRLNKQAIKKQDE